jgi:hypothetical protein
LSIFHWLSLKGDVFSSWGDVRTVSCHAVAVLGLDLADKWCSALEFSRKAGFFLDYAAVSCFAVRGTCIERMTFSVFWF